MFRIPPILLLLVLMLPIVSICFYFKIRQYSIHQTIKTQIEKGVSESDLVLLKIAKEWEGKTSKPFKRINSKEFRYKGEMYDIIRQKTQGDTTFYWCIWDKGETALLGVLDELVEKSLRNNPEQKKGSDNLNKYLSSLFFTKFSFEFLLPSSEMLVYSIFTEHPVSLFLDRTTPPPEILI